MAEIQGVGETIVAAATAAVPAALAIVRLSGAQAFELATKVAGSLPEPRVTGLRTFRNHKKKVLDEGLVLCFEGPASATGEDTVEFHMHGNPVLVENLVETLVQLGARRAQAGEFTRRALMNGRITLRQAEAVGALIHAASVEAGGVALEQLRGQDDPTLNRINEILTRVIAQVEARIDFVEEDIDPDPASDLEKSFVRLQAALEMLLTSWRKGRPWLTGVRIGLFGVPNAGKSTLLNRLLNFDRALVAEEEGTTRDFIEAQHHIGRLPVALIDTAGIRSEGGAIEQAGIVQARKLVSSVDLVLWVRRPEEWLDMADRQREFAEFVGSDLPADQMPPILTVWNFVDLPDAYSGQALPLAVSAKEGEGMEELEEKILRCFEVPQTGHAALITARQAEAVQQAQEYLKQASAKNAADGLPEIVAEDLYAARRSLQICLGEYDRDQTLDQIFSSFCIGK